MQQRSSCLGRPAEAVIAIPFAIGPRQAERLIEKAAVQFPHDWLIVGITNIGMAVMDDVKSFDL